MTDPAVEPTYIICKDVETEGRQPEIYGPFAGEHDARAWLAEVHVSKYWGTCSQMHSADEHRLYAKSKLPKKYAEWI